MKRPDTACSFDEALADVADILTDAQQLEQCGFVRCAAAIYAFAEEYALRSGFLELVSLVWTYETVGAWG